MGESRPPFQLASRFLDLVLQPRSLLRSPTHSLLQCPAVSQNLRRPLTMLYSQLGQFGSSGTRLKTLVEPGCSRPVRWFLQTASMRSRAAFLTTSWIRITQTHMADVYPTLHAVRQEDLLRLRRFVCSSYQAERRVRNCGV